MVFSSRRISILFKEEKQAKFNSKGDIRVLSTKENATRNVVTEQVADGYRVVEIKEAPGTYLVRVRSEQNKFEISGVGKNLHWTT